MADNVNSKQPPWLAPKNFFRIVWRFLVNWASETSVVTLTIASIFGAAELIYLLTGRAPNEDITWLMEYSSRCVAIALAITFTSVSRQAFGHWLRIDQVLDRPIIAGIQAAKSLAVFLACLYVLTH